MQVFASPKSLLKGLTAWQQCILQGREAKSAPAAHPSALGHISQSSAVHWG